MNTAIINGPIPSTNCLYRSVIVKENLSLSSQLIYPNTKYVIKHNFDLNLEVILLPENCIIAVDGGLLSNGTLIGNDSILIDVNRTGEILDDINLLGTWKEAESLTSISIGTVTSGSEPEVTITGNKANPILNFVFPKGDQGEQGPAGNGIQLILLNSDYTLTITYTNGTTYTTSSIRGEQGIQGEQGVSVSSFLLTEERVTDTLYNIVFSDGNTQSISIPKGATGPTGETGPTGNGILNVTLNGDYTLTINYTNGTSYTTSSIRGAQGNSGYSGNIEDLLIVNNLTEGGSTAALSAEMGKELSQSINIKYDNSQSGLSAENVLVAVDETGIGLKTLEQTSPINTDSEAESDLDFADDFGRVLARFENGNIKTKHFNSANAVEAETYPTISEDLDIADENKKVLARFKNGHIQTKYFDSSVGRGAYSSSTIRFTVDVNVNMLKDSAGSATVQDSYVGTYKDNGLLMLPPTYTPQGKPTRLVIAFHGAGGGASDHDSQTEQQTQYKYLVANGYAVMDMNGMPADWVETWWSDCPVPTVKEYCKVNNMGTSLAMECYIKGYEWVIDNYNIARDGVFICGGSMGGMSSSNFVMMGSVPVIAQAIYAPALDTYNQAFLHPWTPVSNPILSKYCLGKLYGFSKDGNDQYIYDADKVTGYNPIINGMESYVNGERVTSVGTYDFTTHYLNGVEVTEYKRYPCPLKIWHCDNDPTVNIACSIRQVAAIKNAGGMAWLRRFPSGGHAPDTAGTVVSNPSGNTILNGASVGTIYPLAEETLLFFNRFNNK